MLRSMEINTCWQSIWILTWDIIRKVEQEKTGLICKLLCGKTSNNLGINKIGKTVKCCAHVIYIKIYIMQWQKENCLKLIGFGIGERDKLT